MSGIMNMFVATKTTIATAVDAFFNSVSLLLNTSSTNGAQNNTFLDSSTNNFSITRNGNTTQGTFTPFSQTGWSNYLNGASNYLSIADNAVFDFGTGNFCVEFWFNAPNQTTSYPAIISSSGYTGALSIRYDNTGYDNKIFVYMGGGGDPVLASTNAISNNVWAHVAVVRDSTTSLKIYVNGVLDGTATISSSLATDLSNGPAYIGRGFDIDGTNAYFTGYVSNVRVTKGGAVYTSAFTPSTTPLTTTVPSGTVSLLTCQSNRFIDNSASPLTITVNGTPSVQAFSPFLPTTAYDAAVVGGSGYFDGTGDYLSLASNANLTPASSTYTFECWVYRTASGAMTIWDTSVTNGFYVHINGSDKIVLRAYGTADIITSSLSAPVNSWFHVAVARGAANSTKMWINGSSTDGGSATDSTTYAAATTYIGIYDGSTVPLTGYISNLRLVKGSDVYGVSNSTITIPTAPLTAITNTVLLLSGTNAGIFDSASKNVLETVGNAQVSTTQAKWGTTSMYFDGTGDWLITPNGKNYINGTEPFTIEFWVYLPSTPSYYTICGAGSGSLLLTIQSLTIININPYGSGNTLSVTTSLSTGTWTHIAATRDYLNRFDIWVNGVSAGNTTSTQSFGSPSSYIIGAADSGGTQTTLAYIDDFRISKFCRYTTTFTPPTAAFPLQ